MKKAKPVAKTPAAKPQSAKSRVAKSAKNQPAPYKAAPATIRFTAELLPAKSAASKGAWAVLSLPKSISAKLAPDTETTMEGAINNIPFRSSAAAGADAGAMLKVGKTIHDFTKANIGDKVSVEITKIGDESETRIPAELSKALASTSPANKKAKALWEDITPIARRDWIFWIITGKLEETRMKRTETAISKLSSGMRRACCFPGINWLMKNGK